MDADRQPIEPSPIDSDGAAAPAVAPVQTVDPAANLPPPAKAPRASPAAQILGALVSSAHADDSVKNQFVAMRATAATPNVDSAFDALLSDTKPAPGVAEGAAQAAQQPAGGDQVSDQTLSSLITGKQPPRPLAERILSGAKAVAMDVGKGVLTSPKQIVGGVLDYGNNLVRFADTVVKKIEGAGVPNAYFELFDKTGKWSPKLMSTDEFRKAQAEGRDDVFQVPTTDEPDAITGNIVRTGTSFLLGRGNIAGKGAGTGMNLLADVVSGATSMDPNSPRLSNIIDQVAPNAVTNFLKAKPEDEGTVMGHIKAGLEMGGLGMAVSGVVKTLKMVKDALSATPAMEGAAEGGADALPAAAGDVSAPSPEASAATPTLDATASAEGATAKPQTALDQLIGMKDDIPWEQPKANGAMGPSVERAAIAGAQDAGGVSAAPDFAAKRALALGYPDATTGHPLSVAAEDTPTVTVSPELKDRFEQYMAQERGDVAAPLEANEKPLADMKSADFSATGTNPVKVNLNAINGPDDLKDAIARVSAQIPAQAVRHNDAVLDAAQSLGMDADAFLAGPGRALSDTEVVGLRMVANDVARQSLEHFKAAAIPGASEESKATALAAYAKFNDLISYMEGAKAESGRGVQAWGIKVAGLDVPYADAVKRIAESAGEPGTPEFMERMAALDGPEQVASAANAARTMTQRDWMLYGYNNALLSPRTVVKKALSDTFMALWNVATRYTAETFGSGNGVQAGEAARLANGYRANFADALAYAQKSFIAGKSQFKGGAGTEFFESFDKQQALAGSAQQIADETPTMASTDFLRSAVQWKSLLPTTWVGAIDDFATFINYRTELGALAYRTATAKGLEGADLENAVASLKASPPSYLHGQAVQAAMANTFKEPLTGWAASMADMVDKMNVPIGHGSNFELPVGRMVMPFIKIPTNIARWSYSNSPLPLLMPSSRVSAELAAGGASRDLALARIGLGTAVSTAFLGMTLSGQITGRGPSDPQLKRAWMAAGNEPNSIKIGDKQYGYNQLEPVGMLAGIIADTHDIMRFAKEEDAGQAALSLVFGTGEALMSKTYLQGVANLFEALSNPDKDSARWFNNLVSSAIPEVGTAHVVQQMMDPWMRQHYHLLDSIEAKLPYLSQGLPPQRTLWGDAIPAKDGYAPFITGSDVARGLSPVQVGPAMDAQPIDKWIWENRMAFPRGPDNKLGLTKPGIVQQFHGGRGIDAQVELTPEQHDRLQVLAGNELKDPSTGLGARDTLNALVEGGGRGMQGQWDKASPAEQALIVQSVVNKFRSAAKMQLLREYPDIQEAVNAGFQARAQQLQSQ